METGEGKDLIPPLASGWFPFVLDIWKMSLPQASAILTSCLILRSVEGW